MRKWLLAAALLGPALWLGAAALLQERALGRSSEWRIPITGYDPRDPLRGQYIQFRYAWQSAGDPAACETSVGCRICLSQERGAVLATATSPGTACPHPVDPRLSRIDIRPTFQPGGEHVYTSRLFISEASAPILEAQLREGPMVVVAALSPDGRLINRRIEPAR